MIGPSEMLVRTVKALKAGDLPVNTLPLLWIGILINEYRVGGTACQSSTPFSIYQRFGCTELS